MTSDRNDQPGRRVSRRHLLLGGAAAGLGGLAAVGGAAALERGNTQQGVAAPPAGLTNIGTDTVPFHGAKQAGLESTPGAHALFVALDLHQGTDAAALKRMLRILSDDAARLTQGDPALADSEPELAAVPARLTVTFGFGAELVRRAAGEQAVPSWLRPLPAFTVDQLEEAWNGGDLLLHFAADDSMTVAHAARMMLKNTRTFADVRWSQKGFRRSRGSEKPGTTMRNLFGQVDGTANLEPGGDDFDRLVYSAGPAWLAGGGTSFVMRRIAMNLDKWDELDRGGREQSVGRTLANGAPLTGVDEHDEPDFDAKTPIGFPVIGAFAHIRRARSDNTDERIFRRAYNYDDTPTGGAVSNSGLIFGSYQADVNAQFVPLQRRLDQLDLLNEWTTPIGSAVFAIPPGCSHGGYIGDTLL